MHGQLGHGDEKDQRVPRVIAGLQLPVYNKN